MLPLSFLQQAGQIWDSVYVVGGFLRERWFGRLSNDLDLVVPMGAIQGAEILARKFNKPWFILDADRDIARIAFSPEFTVDIARMSTAGIDADLAARDLSINALACPLVAELFLIEIPFQDLPFLDPCKGLPDLQNGSIRCIDKRNLVEDPLRLLRVFRFASTCGFEIEQQTLAWVKLLSSSIHTVASERLLQELDKFLSGKNIIKAFEQMVETNLAQEIFTDLKKDQWTSSVRVWSDLKDLMQVPVLSGSKIGFEQPFQHYLAEPLTGERKRRDLIFLVSLFYQDLSDNWVLFAKKIRLGVKDADFGLKILNYKLEIEKIKNNASDKLSRFRFYRKCQETVPALLLLAVVFQELDLSQSSDAAFIDLLLSECFDLTHPYLTLPPLINGNDILKQAKIKPGPLIGKLLLAVQEAQVMELIASKSEALNYVDRLLANDGQEVVS
ncbi:MAG: CCA tRNA nucleotidyltransferase [Candidatus Sericytochromatia bacterium]|nr:CCA tRNA nucleotidyltransferase [Candidatus Sericytochromatia bacterium]